VDGSHRLRYNSVAQPLLSVAGRPLASGRVGKRKKHSLRTSDSTAPLYDYGTTFVSNRKATMTAADSANHADRLFERYQELQRYVGWTPEDGERVRSVADMLESHLFPLIEDFYEEIERHPEARKVISGGEQQIERLKGTLRAWLRELLFGPYDRDYVVRRWKVGWRHVEIGLDQVYTNVALSRLRRGLLHVLEKSWEGDLRDLMPIRRSLNTLLDLDLAIIEDAYQSEYLARQQRSERLAAYRTLVEAAPSMIVILRNDHTIVYFNNFGEELTGHRSIEITGKDYPQIFVPREHRQELVDRIGQVLSARSMREFEMPVVCRDGHHCWMVWNARILDDYDGQPAVLVVGQDISKLKQAQEQALQSERLAGIGQMMTGLAHESGNALARSKACLEMLAWEVEDKPEAIELIGRIQKAQDHLMQLYEEVRGYAAPFKLDCDTWDMAGIWRQAWDNLAVSRQGRTAMLAEETGGMDLHCSVDQFRLEQVFRNILENSLAACADPVRIEIHCAPAQIQNQPAVQVRVRDNGPGLSAEQRARIFDPFFTTKTKGTGLGMAIAKRIVEAHGGRIAVGDTGPGAEIMLILPRESR
jgi:PAS domain S-box-containing protein